MVHIGLQFLGNILCECIVEIFAQFEVLAILAKYLLQKMMQCVKAPFVLVMYSRDIVMLCFSL